MTRNATPLSKAQATALALFAADMIGCEIRPSTILNLVRRGYLTLEPVPANNGLHRPVITQSGRDAAFSSLIAA